MDSDQQATAASKLTKTAHKIIPHLNCKDVEKTAAFYVDCLHFDLGGLHLDVPMVSVAMGAKAEANIYIFGNPNAEQVSVATVMVGLGKLALEPYYQLLVEEGKVEIADDIADRVWGFRQFNVKDLDGNIIQFWAFLDE